MKKSFILSACLFSFGHIMCMEEVLQQAKEKYTKEEDVLTMATRAALKSLSIKKRTAAVSCLVHACSNPNCYSIDNPRTLKKLGIVGSSDNINNYAAIKKMFTDPAFVKDILETEEK